MQRTLIRRISRTLKACVLGLALSTSASVAADLRVVVYYPDGPQDPSQMVAAFVPLKSQARHSQALDIDAQYFVQLADFQKSVDSGSVAFALVDAVFFLENREKLGLEAVATAMNGAGASTQPYCLVVPAGQAGVGVGDLAGKTLAQTPMMSRQAYFVSDFLLEGMLPADFFRPKVVPHADSALKAVELGEANAAFVPCAQAQRASAVRSVFTSRPVPYPIVVAFPGTTPRDRERMRELFSSLGKDSPLLAALQVEKFGPVSADFVKTLQAYRSNVTVSLDDLRVSRPQAQASGSVVPSDIVVEAFPGELRTRFLPADPGE
jgi:ABC-type phosphate/phosphonate transport system substrate-binding protein